MQRFRLHSEKRKEVRGQMKVWIFLLLIPVAGLLLVGNRPVLGETQVVSPEQSIGIQSNLPLSISSDVKAMDSRDSSAWRNYTSGNEVHALALDGNYEWAAVKGGVVRWNRADGSYVKYTTTDGLVNNDVRAIAIDGDGNVWFGTFDGASKFDGNTWTTYDLVDTSSQATGVDGAARNALSPAGHNLLGGGNTVFAVAIDGDGHIWFGTGHGVREFDGANWTHYTTSDGLAGNFVRTIAIDGDGHKWFGTWYDGVSEFDGINWTTYTTAHGLASDSVEVIETDGTDKWFGTYGGVSKFDGTNWTTYTTTHGLVHNSVFAIAIKGTDKWFGTYGGVSKFDGTNWTTYTTTHGLASNRVDAISIDGAGHKWFGTDSGVSEFDGANWTTHTTTDNLASNDVNAVVIDEVEHKWFGTGGGVSVLDENGTPFDESDDAWQTFTTTHGLAYNHVYAIATQVSDTTTLKWFGTLGGVSVLDDKGTLFDESDDVWQTFTTTHGLASDIVEAIAVHPSDTTILKWFGTSCGGVSVLNDKGTVFDTSDDTWQTFTTTHGLAYNCVNAIATQNFGTTTLKWFGTGSGVSVLDSNGTPFNTSDDTWQTFTTTHGLASNSVYAIAIDGNGYKWFGTWYGGVSVLDDNGTPFDASDDTWQVFDTADGLVGLLVNAITIDETGHKWFGTVGTLGGVSVLNDNGTPFNKADDTWQAFAAADGLGSNFINAIVIDENGHKWFGTDSGVSKYMPYFVYLPAVLHNYQQ
jgi:ligand-binding sensor domain-containing protein